MLLALPLYDDQPSVRMPVVTGGLIAVCTLVFLWQSGLGPRASEQVSMGLGMVPARLFGLMRPAHPLRLVSPGATLITHMFLHGSWLHLIGNMIYLWIFGRGVENALGSFRFLVFYFSCGVAAALTQGLIDPSSDIPMIGASGAIAGVLGAYLILYPRANVVVLFWFIIIVRLIAVPSMVLLGLWFLIQLMSALNAQAGEPGVAFWAHVGGFAVGIVLLAVIRPRGVQVFRPARSRAFIAARPREARQRFGGSVPPSGRWRDL